MRVRKSLVMLVYLLFVLVPIYWLVNMSFKSNREILGGLTLWPTTPTLDNYRVQFAQLRVDEHGDLADGRITGSLRVLALSLPGR